MNPQPLTLTFDPSFRRYRIGVRELHRGDTFQIEVGGKWVDVRIEQNDRGWFLVGLPHRPYACNYEGCLCRFDL